MKQPAHAHPTHSGHLSKHLVALGVVGALTAATVSGVGLTRALPAFAQTAATTPAASNSTTPSPATPLNPDGSLPSPIKQISLTAIPPRLGDDGTLTLKPGEKTQTTIRVRNTSSETVRIESFVEDFILADDGVTPIPITDKTSNRWSLAAWTVITPSSQVLKPNQMGSISIIIDTPKDALPGGHYAMVVHRPAALGKNGSDGGFVPASSQVNQRVGTLLYGVVEGPINEEAFIRNFTWPKFTEYGPVPFSFKVDNASDIHISPRISVDIYNFFGAKVDTISLESRNVFPLSSREFNGQWDRVWGIGPYKAKLTMSYGKNGQVTLSSSYFWLLPIKLVLAILTIVIVVLTILMLVRRHLKHRSSDDQKRMKMLEERIAELEENHTQP